MLVYLNIPPREFRIMNREVRIQVLEKFVAASRLGNHLFIVHRNLADWVERKAHLSNTVRTHIKSLDQTNSFQSFGQFMSENTHMEIKYGAFKSKLVKTHKWVIGHEEILKYKYLDPCRLIVENSNSDGKLYELILRNESSRPDSIMKQFRFPLSYELIGGSGNNIANEFARSVTDGYIVCCICDSDKLAPNDKPGETFNNVIDSKRQENIRSKFVGVVTCTPCHESENFLVPEFVYEIIEDELENLKREEHKYILRIKNFEKFMENLKKVNQWIYRQPDPAKRIRLWFYLDLKKGINVNNKRITKIDSKVKQWLSNEYCVEEFNEINIPGIYDNLMDLFIGSKKLQGEFHHYIGNKNKEWKKNFSPWIDKFILYLIGQDINDFEEPPLTPDTSLEL